MEAMVAKKSTILLSTRWRRKKAYSVRHLSVTRRMEAMVAHLLLATRMSAMEIVSLVMETHLSNFEIMQSKRRSSHRHTTQLGFHSIGSPHGVKE